MSGTWDREPVFEFPGGESFRAEQGELAPVASNGFGVDQSLCRRDGWGRLGAAGQSAEGWLTD